MIKYINAKILANFLVSQILDFPNESFSVLRAPFWMPRHVFNTYSLSTIDSASFFVTPVHTAPLEAHVE